MDRLSISDLNRVDDRLHDFKFDLEKSVESRTAIGGTSKSGVTQQIQLLNAML